ncbi:MAG: FAD:protein FMN transferase [Proteobacteria bacterium]|nr:FAD:protein FMN transferase [Pseudomonadota bacterium]
MPVFAPPASAEWYQDEQAIMGTRIAVEFWVVKGMDARQCGDAVMAEMRRIDAEMSPYREDSELSLVNREAASHPVRISPELFNLIQRAQRVSDLSGGAFDITFASVGYLYDYRQHAKPTDQEISQRLGKINYRLIRLDSESSAISFAKQGVRIDLGGIAKGYAVDNGIRILQDCGVKSGLVTAGGDSRILGDRHGRPWVIGIRDPRKKGSVVVALPLSNTAVSTSGDYERFFIENGERYHHILSPATGKSAHATRSVTVLGPDATTTDALSTTVFVLGPERGIRLIDSLAGIDAVVIDARGKMHYSSGLMPPASRRGKPDG